MYFPAPGAEKSEKCKVSFDGTQDTLGPFAGVYRSRKAFRGKATVSI
jgi:hypothetical protein